MHNEDMDAEGSGGGTTEPEDVSQPTARAGPGDSLEELFSSPGGVESKHKNPVMELDERELREATDALEGLQYPDGTAPGPDRPKVRHWTFGTVVVALAAAVLFGYLTVRTGSTAAAFAAGLLVGLGAVFFGLGGLLEVLVSVQ